MRPPARQTRPCLLSIYSGAHTSTCYIHLRSYEKEKSFGIPNRFRGERADRPTSLTQPVERGSTVRPLMSHDSVAAWGVGAVFSLAVLRPHPCQRISCISFVAKRACVTNVKNLYLDVLVKHLNSTSPLILELGGLVQVQRGCRRHLRCDERCAVRVRASERSKNRVCTPRHIILARALSPSGRRTTTRRA